MKKKTLSTRALPKIRIARPKGRPYQLRFMDPDQKREVRISTGVYDEAEAEQQKAKLEAKLLLGIPIDPPNNKKITQGYNPDMSWEDFRELYRTLQLVTLRKSSVMHAESRLDIAARIVKPKTLGDMADTVTLHRLQAGLLAGAESVNERQRSKHTVRTTMGTVLAALRWAYLQGWLPEPTRFKRLKVGKSKVMKGRPLKPDEFQAMLDVTGQVVGPEGSV